MFPFAEYLAARERHADIVTVVFEGDTMQDAAADAATTSSSRVYRKGHPHAALQQGKHLPAHGTSKGRCHVCGETTFWQCAACSRSFLIFMKSTCSSAVAWCSALFAGGLC